MLSTNSYILAHKNKTTLRRVAKKILGYSTEYSFITDTIMSVKCYLDKEEIQEFYGAEGLKIVERIEETPCVDNLLDKISDNGLLSLTNSERLYLSELK